MLQKLLAGQAIGSYMWWRSCAPGWHLQKKEQDKEELNKTVKTEDPDHWKEGIAMLEII